MRRGFANRVVAAVGAVGFTTATVLVLMGLVACKKSGDGGEAPSEDVQRARSLYAKGYNSLLDDPKTMIKDFFAAVPEGGAPAKGKKVRFFPRHNSAEADIKEAEKAFSEAGDEIPDVASVATSTLAAIKKVHSTFREAHNYYDGEDYKDDAGAKGKKLFADMKKAATEFQQGLNKFGDALSALEDKETIAELARFSKDKGPSYVFRNFNFKAKKLLDAGGNTEKYLARFAELEKAHKEADTWRTANEPGPALKAYLGLADGFFNTAKKLKRTLEAKPVKAQQAQQQSKQTISSYNNLVSFGNSLYQLEAQGLLK